MLGLIFWAWFYPEPYWLCILLLVIAVPAALVLPRLTGGYFRLNEDSDSITSAGVLVVGLSVILLARAMLDFNVVNWTRPLAIGALSGAIFAALAFVAEPSLQRPWLRGRSIETAAALLVAGTAYGLGAAIEANVLLDRSDPEIVRISVNEKFEHQGRRSGWRLGLATPNEMQLDDIAADRAVYERALVGRPICVRRQGGALGFGWYWVDVCPEQRS